MEDKRLRSEAALPDEMSPGHMEREEMERELEELGELIEEGNKFFGLPPLSEMD